MNGTVSLEKLLELRKTWQEFVQANLKIAERARQHPESAIAREQEIRARATAQAVSAAIDALDEVCTPE
jgi:hypothetical protein